MDRYYLFRRLMDLVGDDFEVIDADMNHYRDEVLVKGRDADGYTVTITAEIKEAEEMQNGD